MDFWQTVAAISSVAAVLGAFLVWVSRKVVPALRKLSRFIDRFIGIPADPRTGQQEIPGIFERLDRQDADLQTIKHELFPNSGKSLRDAVDQQGKQLAKHLAETAVPTTTINVNPAP